jgi:uncharacterized phage protein (TIGR01671 family)
MREIKFRAWQKREQKMYPVRTLYLDAKEKQVELLGISVVYAFTIGQDVELMQFTGMKDKNSPCQDIYEGDIVKADWHWEKPHLLKWPHDYWALLEYGLESEFNLEVIGNIYENPELLKGEGT